MGKNKIKKYTDADIEILIENVLNDELFLLNEQEQKKDVPGFWDRAKNLSWGGLGKWILKKGYENTFGAMEYEIIDAFISLMEDATKKKFSPQIRTVLRNALYAIEWTDQDSFTKLFHPYENCSYFGNVFFKAISSYYADRLSQWMGIGQAGKENFLNKYLGTAIIEILTSENNPLYKTLRDSVVGTTCNQLGGVDWTKTLGRTLGWEWLEQLEENEYVGKEKLSDDEIYLVIENTIRKKQSQLNEQITEIASNYEEYANKFLDFSVLLGMDVLEEYAAKYFVETIEDATGTEFNQEIKDILIQSFKGVEWTNKETWKGLLDPQRRCGVIVGWFFESLFNYVVKKIFDFFKNSDGTVNDDFISVILINSLQESLKSGGKFYKQIKSKTSGEICTMFSTSGDFWVNFENKIRTNFAQKLINWGKD